MIYLPVPPRTGSEGSPAQILCGDSVRVGRLELPRPRTQEPKSCASASSATPAADPSVMVGYSPNSSRSLATWPFARTLYIADLMRPSAPMTNVERMTPRYVLP